MVINNSNIVCRHYITTMVYVTLITELIMVGSAKRKRDHKLEA